MSADTPEIRPGKTTKDFIEWVQILCQQPQLSPDQRLIDILSFCNKSLKALEATAPDAPSGE